MNSLTSLLPYVTTSPGRLRAEKARRSLLHFTSYTYPRYVAEPAHALIAEAIEQAIDTPDGRLMIFAPPQHGKSELVSVRTPAYALGRKPDQPVIIASYGATLAQSKSRQCREIVEDGAYQAVFPETRTDPERRAADNWGIHGKRGGMIAVGVGGPITGHGTSLGIIDDPIENWEQAQSETYRNKLWDWYRGTFRTRIWEGGSIILIMTRWHEDDLAGRLLRMQGDQWRVLRLPALAETQDERDAAAKKMGLPLGESDPLGRAPGDPLCPNRYSVEALEQLRRDVGSLAWAAEYQGAPTAPEGNLFKRAWFERVQGAPEAARRVRYWDFAATQDGGAYTAGALVAYHKGTTYIENVARGQWSTGTRQQRMVMAAEADHEHYRQRMVCTWFEQEPGSSGKDSAQATLQLLNRWPVRADRVTGSKDVRMEPFRAQCEAGNVKLIDGPWIEAWLDEICAIPNSRYRDQADATAGAYNKLVNANRGFSIQEY